MSLFNMIPKREYLKSPIFALADVIGFAFGCDTDPQWNDTLLSQTFPDLIEGLVFYGVVSEDKAEVLLGLWAEAEGTVDEPLPEVLLLNVLYS